MADKERYLGLIERIAEARACRFGAEHGAQVRSFSTFLLERTDWLSAPASSKYHLSQPGGLLHHSLTVVEVALGLASVLAPGLAWDSVALCALFHDVGKVWGAAGRPGEPLKPRYEANILKSGQQSQAEPYKVTKEGAGFPTSFLDAILPAMWINLQECELQALWGADGQYVPETGGLRQHEHPLTLVVHWADYWTARVLESNPGESPLLERFDGWLAGLIRG